MSIESGILYIVATPIGNLGDISPRALQILTDVDVIAAEDTRHTGRLLAHFGIKTAMTSVHDHNESQRSAALVRRLLEGVSIALVSDAGTPLISDPGYRVVSEARAAGVRVSPIPGVSALIAALSASGLPTDRFVFEGFLPSKATARQGCLQRLREETGTLVFYESSHRIVASVQAMQACFGDERLAVLARELTKTFEQIHSAPLSAMSTWLQSAPEHQKGEFVVMLRGQVVQTGAALDPEVRRVLALLLKELPVKSAARLAADIFQVPKNQLYEQALQIKRDDSA